MEKQTLDELKLRIIATVENYGGVARYFASDWLHIFRYGNRACHAGLSVRPFYNTSDKAGIHDDYQYNIGYDNRREFKPEVLFNLVLSEDKRGNRGKYKDWLQWMMNEGPYCEAFLDKDADRCLKESIIAYDGNVAGNLLGAAMISTRQLWEYTQIPKYWNDLVASGWDKKLAYLISNYTSIYSACGTLMVAGSGHKTFGDKMSNECVINYLNGVITKKLRPFKTNLVYSPISVMYNAHPLQIQTNYGNFLDTLSRLSKAKSMKSDSPFNRSNSSLVSDLKIADLVRRPEIQGLFFQEIGYVQETA